MPYVLCSIGLLLIIVGLRGTYGNLVPTAGKPVISGVGPGAGASFGTPEKTVAGSVNPTRGFNVGKGLN